MAAETQLDIDHIRDSYGLNLHLHVFCAYIFKIGKLTLY